MTYLCVQLMKDYPTANLFNVHENLIEALLELQAYADVQALLVKYDGLSLMCYYITLHDKEPELPAICYRQSAKE